MITSANKHLYKFHEINVDLVSLSEYDYNLVINHSYFEILEGRIIIVVMEYNDEMSGVIGIKDANKLASEGYGYFKKNILNEEMFVFTKTYPRNYINFALYEYIANKDIFSITITYDELKDLALNEKPKVYAGLYYEDNFIYLVKNQVVFSDRISPLSGKPFADYTFWGFNSEPGILYKYTKR
jgi:hypothetical protein